MKLNWYKKSQETVYVYKTVIVRYNTVSDKMEFRSLYNPNNTSQHKWIAISIGSPIYGKWYVGTKAKFCLSYYSGNEDLRLGEYEVLLKLQVPKSSIPDVEEDSYMGSEAVVINPLVVDIEKTNEITDNEDEILN